MSMAILVKSIMRFGPDSMVQEMPFKVISHLQLWQPSFLVGRNHLDKFGKGLYDEHFYKFILNS